MKLLFIHIPKTGGTSIIKFLNEINHNSWNRSWPMGHDPYFEMERENTIDDEVYSFAVVRNPYTRAYSYYKHYIFQNHSQISFYEFLNRVRVKDSTENTPMIIYNQSFYTHDSLGQIKLSKIYRFENMEEIEYDFEINLPRLRVGEYDKKEMLEAYSPEIISLVKHLYLEDFINFSYSFDFSHVIK